MSSDPLGRLADLPGVAEAVAAAREACTQLRWHEALRRRTSWAAAEATARAARESAVMEGAELPLDVVRDVLRGARPAPPDAAGRTVSGALRATVEAGALGDAVRRSPLRALARLHTAAAAGLLPDDALGRPRSDGERPRDLAGPGEPPTGAHLRERLAGLAALMASSPDVPALVVAGLVHAEVLAIRPFVVGNGVVARALFRAAVVERGLDPTAVAVPEAGFTRLGLPAYATAVTSYATGTPEGVAAWLVHCADAVLIGAQEGQAVADAVLAGRLGG